MNKIVTISLLVGLGASTLLADGASLYKGCVGCHGASGEKVALGKSKVIKDMTKAELESSLLGYQAGTYGGVMKGLMKSQVGSMSNKEIDALSMYIATF